MGSFGENENLEYVICLNSRYCQVFNEGHTTYEVIKRGCLAKFQYRDSGQNCSVRTLVTNKCEVYMQDSLDYIAINLKLFKYLNAINDFEERIKFYSNEERRSFVLHLGENSVVSAGFSSGKQMKAVFQGINENEEKIFIIVELLERPFKYSLPANMVHTIAIFESNQKDNRGWLEKFLGNFCFCCCLAGIVDYSALEYWRWNDNVQNNTTSYVSRGESIYCSVDPGNKELISQNPGGSGQQENDHEPHKNVMLDRSYNNEPEIDITGMPVVGNAKRDENNCEREVGSAQIIPSSMPSDLLINSKVCHICSNVCEDNICLSCANETPKISQTIIDIPINSELCDECSNVYEGNTCPSCGLEKNSGHSNSQINVDSNTHVDNEDDLSDDSKIAVRPNRSASSCTICKNHLDKFEGFFLMLCKHTFCETCIKKQINKEMLAHTNIIPCCDRPIELDEIQYFLPTHEYEPFKSSCIQQCFDKNCSGYHLWEECGENKERPITFTCNKCKLDNCLKCRTIHVNLTCEQYGKITCERNSVDNETIQMFLIWIRAGKAMPCPNCEALIEKDEGCDWVECPFCKTEICWATRGPRWGLGGKGDTSGGCGCDFNVKKCVENCNYCH